MSHYDLCEQCSDANVYQNKKNLTLISHLNIHLMVVQDWYRTVFQDPDPYPNKGQT